MPPFRIIFHTELFIVESKFNTSVLVTYSTRTSSALIPTIHSRGSLPVSLILQLKNK